MEGRRDDNDEGGGGCGSDDDVVFVVDVVVEVDVVLNNANNSGLFCNNNASRGSLSLAFPLLTSLTMLLSVLDDLVTSARARNGFKVGVIDDNNGGT